MTLERTPPVALKAGDLAELAVRNLREALLRNSLTTLGVAVGVGVLVGPAIVGVVYDVVGPTPIFILNAASFVVPLLRTKSYP